MFKNVKILWNGGVLKLRHGGTLPATVPENWISSEKRKYVGAGFLQHEKEESNFFFMERNFCFKMEENSKLSTYIYLLQFLTHFRLNQNPVAQLFMFLLLIYYEFAFARPMYACCTPSLYICFLVTLFLKKNSCIFFFFFLFFFLTHIIL